MYFAQSRNIVKTCRKAHYQSWDFTGGATLSTHNLYKTCHVYNFICYMFETTNLVYLVECVMKFSIPREIKYLTDNNTSQFSCLLKAAP